MTKAKFGDIKCVIRGRKSKKDRQYNDQNKVWRYKKSHSFVKDKKSQDRKSQGKTSQFC